MSLPRYPHYKDSGVEWLGEVPEHWVTSQLKKGLLVLTDFTANGSFASLAENVDYQSAGFARLIRMTDLRHGLENEGIWVDENAYKYLAKSSLLGGELLMASVGSVGLIYLMPHVEYPASLAPNMYLLKTNANLLAGFLYWCLMSNSGQEQIFQAATTTAQPKLNKDNVRSLVICYPPIPEQTQIAAFLDRETAKIDALVAEQRRLMALLKEKRQALISHAVTRGLNPDAPMKPSGIEWLGDVPAHWEVTRMANVFREVSESGTDELPILSVSIHHGVSDKEMDADEMERKVTRSDDRTKYKQVAPGDLVYNMMRAWQGGFGTVVVIGMVSPAYVVARPKMSVETTYIEHLLRTHKAIEQIRRHSRGITDFRLRLYWDEFKNLGIAIPPDDEAKASCSEIAEMESKFSNLTAACEKSIALLQERRTALISAAVTGQIDVRDVVTLA